MMDSFKKLLTNSAVYSWSLEIHQGIVTMLELFVDLLLARMPHAPVPCDWLNHILAPVSAERERGGVSGSVYSGEWRGLG